MAIKNLAALESSLGLSPGDFEKMYKDTEEKEIPIGDFEIIKKTDFAERLKNEKAAEFTKGKDVGMEIKSKEFFTAFGLDVDKTLTGDKIAEKVKETVITAAKLPTDAKVKELEGDKKTLAQKLLDKENELTTVKSTYEQREKVQKVDNFVYTKMPAKGMALDQSRLSVLFKTDFSPKLNDDGKVVFHDRDGNVIKNQTTMNPSTIDEILPEWQKAFEAKAGGGKGGSDVTGNTGKAGDMDAFITEMAEKGIKPNTPEFNKERRERFKK